MVLFYSLLFYIWRKGGHDWTISQVEANVDPLYLDVFNSYHSAFNFSISAKRQSGYYIWKVIVPLMLIVFMSWTVFWIDPSNLGPQIGMSATSMLTLIAFQFAMANILPKLAITRYWISSLPDPPYWYSWL